MFVSLAPPPYEGVDLRREKSFRLPADLFSWRFMALFNTEETGVMFRLIGRSMTEVPAGSLPNDEQVLIDIAGFRDQVERWPAVRAKVLSYWQACSDGRIYNLELIKSISAMGRQIAGRQTGQSTRFVAGINPVKLAGIRAQLEAGNAGQPELGVRRGVPRADAAGYAVGTPQNAVSGTFLSSEGENPNFEALNSGQPELGVRRAVPRGDAVGEGGSRAHTYTRAEEVTSSKEDTSLKETTSTNSTSGSSGGGCREEPDLSHPADGQGPSLSELLGNENSNRVWPTGPDGPSDTSSEEQPVHKISGKADSEKPAAGLSDPKREATARLKNAAKAAGKTTRRNATVVFPCQRFPEKIAYLWNEIVYEPYAKSGSALGGRGQGPLNATQVANLRMRYVAAQRKVHGVTRPVTTLQDWAEFFVYISTSKFLMGGIPSRDGGSPFRISLSWLLGSEDKFFKVRSGRYHENAKDLVEPMSSATIPEFDKELLASFSPVSKTTVVEPDGEELDALVEEAPP